VRERLRRRCMHGRTNAEACSRYPAMMPSARFRRTERPRCPCMRAQRRAREVRGVYVCYQRCRQAAGSDKQAGMPTLARESYSDIAAGLHFAVEAARARRVVNAVQSPPVARPPPAPAPRDSRPCWRFALATISPDACLQRGIHRHHVRPTARKYSMLRLPPVRPATNAGAVLPLRQVLRRRADVCDARTLMFATVLDAASRLPRAAQLLRATL